MIDIKLYSLLYRLAERSLTGGASVTGATFLYKDNQKGNKSFLIHSPVIQNPFKPAF